MNWHNATIAPTELSALLDAIARTHGVITECTPASDGIHLTWTTTVASRW